MSLSREINKLQLIVGLGNPGQEYHKTRHNAGAWFVEELARIHNVTLQPEKKFLGQAADILINNCKLRILLPSTYMNNSGQSLIAISNYYNIPVQNILVIHDELDFPAGVIRLKKNGGHGGHNGLRDIIKKTGSKDFMRLRIGIGHPGDANLVSDYVLNLPSKNDKLLISDAIDSSMQPVLSLLQGQWENAVQQIHNI